MRTTHIYRIYDVDEVLLYVGRSWDPHGRMQWHKRPWYSSSLRYGFDLWRRMATYTISPAMTAAAAEDAEFRAIRTEKPVFNKLGRADDAPTLADLRPLDPTDGSRIRFVETPPPRSDLSWLPPDTRRGT